MKRLLTIPVALLLTLTLTGCDPDPNSQEPTGNYGTSTYEGTASSVFNDEDLITSQNGTLAQDDAIFITSELSEVASCWTNVSEVIYGFIIEWDSTEGSRVYIEASGGVWNNYIILGDGDLATTEGVDDEIIESDTQAKLFFDSLIGTSVNSTPSTDAYVVSGATHTEDAMEDVAINIADMYDEGIDAFAP